MGYTHNRGLLFQRLYGVIPRRPFSGQLPSRIWVVFLHYAILLSVVVPLGEFVRYRRVTRYRYGDIALLVYSGIIAQNQ